MCLSQILDIFLIASLEEKMKDIKNETVVQRIKELRIQKGYTLESLGKSLGVTKKCCAVLGKRLKCSHFR